MGRAFMLYGPCRPYLPPPMMQHSRLCILIILLFVILMVNYVFVTQVGDAGWIPLNDSTTNQSSKVIIVGAGSAGLQAAYSLEKLGWDYELLEASSVYGGRVKQLPAGAFLDDVPLDVGAEWIHVQPHILQDLLLFENETVTDETIVYAPRSHGFFLRGRTRPRNFVRYFQQDEFKFFNSTWYSYFSDYIVPYLDPGKIHYDSPVGNIDYSGEGVVVTLEDGQTTFAGDKVIVAVPLHFLQDEEIALNPPLPPSVVTALDSGEWQSGFKVAIEFSHRFYRDMVFPVSLWSLLTGGVQGEELYFNAVFGKQTKHQVMGALLVGEEARPFLEGVTTNSPADQEIIFQRVLKKLDDMFDGRASKYHVKHVVQNWSGERWIGGTYTVNGVLDREPLLGGVDGKVFFAGEYIARDDVATVHGAALSGRQAVNACANAIFSSVGSR